ncbi:MAG: hypothetical protein PUP93_13280 [Rhizonema sp. NSF051]|nr:hypothetical protein [Rhizonema sp. NSF051]
MKAIALTAYAGEVDQQQALHTGFQQHLAKLVEPDALVQVIAQQENDKKKVPETLDLLERRLPIEKSAERLTLQPVIIEYMTERLIGEICEEIENGNIKLFNKYALFKALAKDYIRESQSNLILKPVENRLIFILRGKSNVEAQFQKFHFLIAFSLSGVK